MKTNKSTWSTITIHDNKVWVKTAVN